jgi:hypothetical protein
MVFMLSQVPSVPLTSQCVRLPMREWLPFALSCGADRGNARFNFGEPIVELRPR